MKVIPTSKYGGTAEVGRAIAEALRARGIDVDISQPEDLFDLSPYAAYIVGSGLYLGRWIDRAVDFVDEYHEALSKEPEVPLIEERGRQRCQTGNDTDHHKTASGGPREFER